MTLNKTYLHRRRNEERTRRRLKVLKQLLINLANLKRVKESAQQEGSSLLFPRDTYETGYLRGYEAAMKMAVALLTMNLESKQLSSLHLELLLDHTIDRGCFIKPSLPTVAAF